jgi:hypothetical protein
MAIYTKAQLYTELRDILNDPTPGNYVSNTELNAWIDRAARNISALTLCYTTISTSSGVPTTFETITTVASTYRYNIGLTGAPYTKFINVHSVTFEPAATTPYGLQRIDVRHFGHGFAKGETGAAVVPKYYFVFGNSLYIWPSPIGTANVGTYIKVYGNVSCEDYVHTDTLEVYGLPDRLQPVVMDFALSCAYQKIGKFQKASMHMSNYLAAIEFERKDNYDRKMSPESKDMYEIPTRNVAAKQG